MCVRRTAVVKVRGALKQTAMCWAASFDPSSTPFSADNFGDAAAISRAVEAVLPDGMAATDETLEAINKACAGKTGVAAEKYAAVDVHVQTKYSLQASASNSLWRDAAAVRHH